MGRGRGRAPHAETSGVQGHVYAITSPAELADQPVIQGTFLLSRLWKECYLILVRRIHSLLHSCDRVGLRG